MAEVRVKRSEFPELNELRHRVVFQSRQETDDGYGGKTVSWQDVFEAWAKIEPVSASERFKAMGMNMKVSHRIYIRYRPEVSSKMRIKYGKRKFEIEGIIDIGEQKKYLELLCSE